MKDSELRKRAKALALNIIAVCDEVDTRKGRGVFENRIGISGDHLPDVVSCEDKSLSLTYKNTPYSINLKKGCFIDSAKITSEQGEIEFSFS